MARNEAVGMLRHQPTEVASHADEMVGLTAVSYGDRWTGTNLLEQSVDGHAPSVSSRFNLAAGYEQTGRLREAAALYRTLVSDGQFTWAISRKDPLNQQPYRRFNIAEESSRRLARIDQQMAFAPATGTAFAAADAATPVAALVGGTTASGRISDAEALRRDGIAP